MKNKLFCIVLAAGFLCSCGDEVGTIDGENDDIQAVMADADAGTTAPETTPPMTTIPPTEAPDVNTEPPAELMLAPSGEVEVYAEITLEELLGAEEIALKNGSEAVDTSQTGTFEITAEYAYSGQLYAHPISYTVADTTPPVVLNSGNSAMAELGSEFDLSDYVGFADNYDPTPELTYTGYVDTSVCGTYYLTATATDSSGNAVTWDTQVEVVSEIPVPEDNNPRLAFSTLIERYSAENAVFGIDVSKWQGEIDFEAVRDAGCSFVIMRIGTYYDEYALDQYFATNIEAAKNAGLDVGVYIYTTANSEDEARGNARWIAENLAGAELDFPVVFDWESFSNFQQYEMSIHDLNCYFEAFADELEGLGYSAMLYSSKNFLNNFWYDHSDEYPIWLAHYTDETDYAGEYSMWQMSCYGQIDGIWADVDLNILYTDKPMN